MGTPGSVGLLARMDALGVCGTGHPDTGRVARIFCVGPPTATRHAIGSDAMREVQIVVRDDLDGTPATPDDTMTFAFDGRTYEIDLAPKNREKFRKLIQPYIDVARPEKKTPKTARKSRAKASAQKRRPAGTSPTSAQARAKEYLDAGEPLPPYLQRTGDLIKVREWAQDNGWPDLKTQQGRMRREVFTAYNEANPNDYVEPPNYGVTQ